MVTQSKVNLKQVLNIAVIVAALGYFVDVYDLVLFLIVGKESLKELLPGILVEDLDKKFDFLLNVQMVGMLIGGILWGILGDKKGRLSVLFGSILIYSLANIANGLIVYVPGDPDTVLKVYAVLRFIAGFGLAGELGAGVTLVSEIMSKETRGYGTMIIASVGVTGAIVAGVLGIMIDWEITYYIGGGLGLALLLLRIGVFESGLFENVKESTISRGNFLSLFSSRHRALKYLKCILIGLPVWYFIGILVGKGPRIAGILGVNGEVKQQICVMLCYTGLVFGDIFSGVLSQFLKSRKKVFYVFYVFCILSAVFYLNLRGAANTTFYTAVTLLGFSVGFWAVLVTVGSEQFGTNIRATAATTIPNFIRGSLVLITSLFWLILDALKPEYGDLALLRTAAIVTIIVMAISFAALFFLDETFGKDLDYVEDHLNPEGFNPHIPLKEQKTSV